MFTTVTTDKYTMMYFRYFLLATVSFLFNIFVYVTSPLWGLIAAAFKLKKFPYPFSMVHTHDNNIYGGTMPTKFSDRWKRAIWWLMRNPGYGFDAWVLGVKGSDIIAQTTIRQRGVFSDGNTALYFVKFETSNGKYFSYRRNIKLFKGRYIKMWFGWHYNDQAGYRILKFDINPFKKAD